MLDRGTQPPADVQTNPSQISVMSHGTLDKVMRNGIKGSHGTLPISAMSRIR